MSITTLEYGNKEDGGRVFRYTMHFNRHSRPSPLCTLGRLWYRRGAFMSAHREEYHPQAVSEAILTKDEIYCEHLDTSRIRYVRYLDDHRISNSSYHSCTVMRKRQPRLKLDELLSTANSDKYFMVIVSSPRIEYSGVVWDSPPSLSTVPMALCHPHGLCARYGRKSKSLR